MRSVRASIIVCTRNRAGDLRETLSSLSKIEVPNDLPSELIVVDNASTDHTKDVIDSADVANITVRYIHEPSIGQVIARNTGIAAARGEVILFTDDDVRVPCNWIEGMCAPIFGGRANGVAGGIRISPHLERPWMHPFHRVCLASTEWMHKEEPEIMVGANMAFSSDVLKKVPAFDPELGPGALGFMDDSLFSYQLKVAGYKLISAPDVEVEHHPLQSRLLRSSFYNRMRGQGRSKAYIEYHWRHQKIPFVHLRLLRRSLKLAYTRLRNRQPVSSEGMPVWEMCAISEIYMLRQYLVESRRPRQYAKHGLVKLGLVAI